MGSVRYFFSTQDELLQFAMRAIISRAAARIQSGAADRDALVSKGDAGEAAAQVLEQVLPLDEERIAEAQVWLAFTAQGVVDEAMARIRQEADEGVRDLCRTCLTDLSRLGRIEEDRDLDLEIERLWSLLDGLTLHILLKMAPMSAARVAKILRIHLRDLQHPAT